MENQMSTKRYHLRSIKSNCIKDVRPRKEIDLTHPSRSPLERILNLSLIQDKSLDYKQYFMQVLKRDILRCCEDIQCKIHKIGMSGPYYYDSIQSELGPLKVDGTFSPKDRLPYYMKRAIKQFENKRVNFFFSPVEPYYPKCYLECSDHSGPQEFVQDLYDRFPLLQMSSIEYTVDFVCKSFAEVRSLNLLLRHYLFYPRQQKVTFYDEGLNLTCHIGKSLRLYERPPGGLRKPWTQDDLKTLRIEYLLRGDALRSKDLLNPENFIENANFSTIMKDRMKFMFARPGTSFLPQEWEPYQSLMQEYIKVVKQNPGKNLSQALLVDEDFEDFKAILMDKMRTFDIEWNRQDRVMHNYESSRATLVSSN